MALVLDASVGGASANSYVTVAEAIAYFEARMATVAWDAAAAPDRERALVAATARLNQEAWHGTRVAETQRLAWPRAGVLDLEGAEYPDTAIPQALKDATCERALASLTGAETDSLAPTGLEAFRSLSAGSVSLELREDAPRAGDLTMAELRLIGHLLLAPTGAPVRLARA